MRVRGTVVDWRGTFGFVKPASGGLNVFVHHSDIQMEGYRELFKGDVVEFEYGSGDRGVKAMRVQVIEPSGANTGKAVSLFA